MSVDVAQGPISRKLGIATVDIYTAGYTGVAGGAAGPRGRRAEASSIHVSNFADLRESVLSIVRGRPLFAATVSDVGAQMLSELRKRASGEKINKILSRLCEKQVYLIMSFLYSIHFHEHFIFLAAFHKCTQVSKFAFFNPASLPALKASSAPLNGPVLITRFLPLCSK